MAKTIESKMDNASEKSSAKEDNKSVKSKESTKAKESTKSTISSKKSEVPEEKKRLRKITTEMNEDIVQAIKDKCEQFKMNEDASKIAEELYKMLEQNYPKGWCVFVGSHFYGLCVHEEKFCMEFEIDDYRVGIFKTYVPNGSK